MAAMPPSRHEVVKTGGTLKPGHRRLVLRDNRLLPKPPPDPNRRRWPPPPKVKYLTEGEADRLFGPSLRTRNRDVMDLATDEAQLKRYGLPLWRTEADVAAALVAVAGTVAALEPSSPARDRAALRHLRTSQAIGRRAPDPCAQAASQERAARPGPAARVQAAEERACAWLRQGPLDRQQRRPARRQGRGHALRHQGLLSDHPLRPRARAADRAGIQLSRGGGARGADDGGTAPTGAAEGKLYHVPTGPRVCVQGAPTSPGLCNAILRGSTAASPASPAGTASPTPATPMI